MSEIKIPSGWKLKKLGEKSLIKPTKGKKPSQVYKVQEPNHLPYLDIKAFEKKNFNQFALPNDGVICNPEDILIVWDGSRSGLVGYNQHGLVGSTIMKLEIKDKIIPKYLYYFLMSKYDILNKNPRGGAIPHVDPNVFYDLEILFPEDIKIQEKLVKKLDVVLDQLEEKKKKILENFEKFNVKKIDSNFKNHLLKMAFNGTLLDKNTKMTTVDDKQIPIGWEPKIVSDIIEILYGKGLPKNERNEFGEFDVFGSNGVVGHHDQYLVDFPSIVIGRKGSAGAINLAPEKFWATDVTYYVKLKDPKIPLKYVYYLLKYLNLPKYTQSGPKPGLNRNDVYKLKIFHPSYSIQKNIIKKLDSEFIEWEKQKSSLEKIEINHENQKKYLVTLRSSIITSTFSGKLKIG